MIYIFLSITLFELYPLIFPEMKTEALQRERRRVNLCCKCILRNDDVARIVVSSY